MKKRVISLLLVICLLISLLPVSVLAVHSEDSTEPAAQSAVFENPFGDIKSTDWYYDAVQYAAANGFFQGTSETEFSPDGTMTRGMFVTVLARMAGVDTASYSVETPFTDVSADAWYAPAVVWAAKYGITSGMGNGAFAPDATINREQMAAFFVRYFEAFDVNYETGADVQTVPADLDSVSDWAQDAVLKLWKQGLLNGDGKSFAPSDNATRAQTASLGMRVDKAVETWYSEPGVESQRVSVDPAAPAEQTPATKPSGSTGGGSNSGSGSGTTTTTYYEVKFAFGDGQTAAGVTLPETNTYVAGTPINTLPTPSKPGTIFLGWYYDAAMTNGVETGDTVTRNMTLYAKMAAGEEVQPVETPNYVTKTDVPSGNYTFDVVGTTITKGTTLKFINITGGNSAVDYSVSGTAVTASLEAGQTYQVELLDDAAQFRLSGESAPQSKSIRYLNILTAKAEVKNASLNKDIKQIRSTAVTGLNNNVFEGLYQIDQNGNSTQNATTGTFTYSIGGLQVGDTVAVLSGLADLNDITSTEGDVAYLKITSADGNNKYGYEMADVKDVLFMPDILPIGNNWDSDSVDNQITITAAQLNTALNNVDAEGLDVGDFLCFINEAAYSNNATADSYGRVTGYEQNDDNYVIFYSPYSTVGEGEAAIEAALDVYYTQDVDVELSEAEKAELEQAIKNDVKKSGYPEEAAKFLRAVVEESISLMDAPAVKVAAKAPLLAAPAKKTASVEFNLQEINVKIQGNGTLEHLKNKNGVDVEITVPFKVKIGDKTEIEVKATFEEEVILGQKISTDRHKIGFLKYDYSINATFDVGNYTGVSFKANITTTDGDDGASKVKELDEVLERIENYLNEGGVQSSDGSIEKLAELYQDVMENANDTWLTLVEQTIFESTGSAFLHIFCWQIKASFVVSANLAASVGMTFDYATQKQYNFSVRLKTEETTNQAVDIITPQYNFDFYVIGTTGVRAGLKLEMYVGLVSLALDKIGITAEAGAYAQLWGYFFYHLNWTEGQAKQTSSAGAMLIEIGAYLEIKFVAQAFSSNKLTWNPTLYANQWPLWSAGEKQNVYEFETADDTDYEFKTVKTLAIPGSTYTMKYMDLKSGEIGTVSKDDTEESAFTIDFSNSKFTYDASANTVTVAPANGSLNEETDMVITWKKAPLSFTSKPIQKVIHITWSDPEGACYISFDSMGGSAVPQITGGVGASIAWPAAPEKTGYTFAGWYTNKGCTSEYSGSTTVMPSFSGSDKGMTLYAKWTPNSDTSYTVEHYRQELNGSYTLADTEYMTGTTEGQTAAEGKSYTGFTAKTITQQTIAADGGTVVEIYYDRNTYTVTFNPGYAGGADVVQTYKYGAELTAPTPARDGYTFNGWIKQGASAVANLPVTVTESTTYTADWTANECTVTFNSMGGGAIAAAESTTGSKITVPSSPARTGYTFGGWYTNKSCTKKWDFSTDTVAGDMILYAKWTANPHTVTFVYGNGNDNSAQPCKYGETLTEPSPAPTRTGYTFGGWYTDENCTEAWDFEADTVAGNMTLYAEWTANTNTAYSVKHYLQNVDNGYYTIASADTEEKTGTTGEQTAAEARQYTGFTAQEFAQTDIAADGSTVVEIYYDRNTYTVTWMNGAETLETDENVRYGAKPKYDGSTPTKTEDAEYSYQFAGWNTAADGSGTALSANDTVSSNVDYYAQFSKTARTYQITYETYGGKSYDTFPTSYTFGRGATLVDSEKTGYTFAGWYADSGFSGEAITEVGASETGDKTFYAKWTASTDTKYKVEHYLQNLYNDEYYQDYNNHSLYNEILHGTTGTQTDAKAKVFEGFTVKDFNQETIAADGSTVVEIYYDRITYNVELHYCYEGHSDTTKTHRHGAYLLESLRNPERDGYTFNGWYKEEEYENNWNTGTPITENLDLYAKWTVKNYTVTFDPQGGICDMKTKLVTYDSSYGDLPIPTHSEEDREFVGWFTAETGGDQVTAATVVKITGNQTLYAHWNYTGRVSTTTTYDNINGEINLWVGGTHINGSSTGGSGNIQGVESVSYDASTKTYTLVLRGYKYEGKGYTSGALNYCIYFAGAYQDTLVIELKGDNSLKNTGSERNGTSAGIYVDGANLTIKGDGTLDITTGTSRVNCGINAGRDLRIESGTLNVTANKNLYDDGNNNSWGMFFGSKMYIDGGTITARGYTQAVEVSNNSQYKDNPVQYDSNMDHYYKPYYDGTGYDQYYWKNSLYFHAEPKTN